MDLGDQLHKEALNGSNNSLTYDSNNLNSFYTMREVKAPVCVLVIVLCTFGLVGNLLSFLVMKRSKITSTTLWLKFLAIFDSLSLAFGAIISVFETIKVRAHYATYMIPLANGMSFVSIWVVVFVSLERYVAVVYPFKVKSVCTVFRVKTLMLTMTAFQLLMQIPCYFEYDLVKCNEPSSGICEYRPTVLFKSFLYQLLYRVTYRAMFGLFLPVAIMTYSSVSLIKALRQRKSFLAKTSGCGSLKSTDNKNETTVMVVGVVIVLIVCQLPLLVYLIIDSISIVAPSIYKHNHLYIFQNITYHVVSVMVVMNCSVNFIIYILTSKRFREQLHKMCKWIPKKQNTGAALRVATISQQSECITRL